MAQYSDLLIYRPNSLSKWWGAIINYAQILGTNWECQGNLVVQVIGFLRTSTHKLCEILGYLRRHLEWVTQARCIDKQGQCQDKCPGQTPSTGLIQLPLKTTPAIHSFAERLAWPAHSIHFPMSISQMSQRNRSPHQLLLHSIHVNKKPHFRIAKGVAFIVLSPPIGEG